MLLFLIIVIISSHYWGIFNEKRTKEEFETFFNSNIQGRISDVGILHKGNYFKIKGCDTSFVFYPYEIPVAGENNFIDIAEPNDSIFKPSKCDTLKLIKNGRNYFYTFIHHTR